MNIIWEYSLDQVRKNRRTSVSIIFAILIASTFLCTLLVFSRSFWNQMVQQEIFAAGNWDAELMDVPADKLALIEDHAGVDAVLVKGDNQTVSLPEGTALPTLMIQNCDAGYWNEMWEKNRILNGRIPEAPGEIVAGKDFFSQNPAYQIGDTLELESGSLTLVGELDVSVSTGYDGYLAYGWLNRDQLAAGSEVVVYLQMKQRGRVYETVPQIAQAVGLSEDEYGDLPCRYHSILLGWYGVYAPGTFLQSDQPKLFFGLLLAAGASMAVFTYIIRGAFGISAKQKIHQIGILKSVGAGPKQIARTVLYEACILSVLPILLSAGLSCLFSFCILSVYSDMTSEVFGSRIEVIFSPLAALISSVISFAAVLFAAYGPAKQIAGLLPIEAVRGEQYGVSAKKMKDHPVLAGQFGFIGEIAENSVHAGKKLFHTCMVTLTLCMLLMFGFLAVFTVSDISNAKAELSNHFNINITLKTGERIEETLITELKGLPEVREKAVFAMADCAMWLSPKDLSKEFLSVGGFETNTAADYVIRRNGRYRIPCVLIGLEEEAYRKLLREKGVGNTPEASAVLVNTVAKNPDARGYEAMEETVPYLNFGRGHQIELTEKYSDSVQGDHIFRLDVAAVLDAMPDIGQKISFYTLPVIVPMEEYYAIIGNFSSELEVYNYRNYINFIVPDQMDEEVQRKTDQICSAYLGSSDFSTSSKTERMKNREKMTGAMMLVVSSLSAMFGAVGIFSALSAILNSLGQRRKEFAMLRSAGMDEKGIRRLLGLEGFLLAVRPILIGLPFLILACAVLCFLQDVSAAEFFSVFPVWALGLYIVLVLLVINGIYRLASKEIRDDAIVEAIKDDTV